MQEVTDAHGLSLGTFPDDEALDLINKLAGPDGDVTVGGGAWRAYSREYQYDEDNSAYLLAISRPVSQ